MMNSADEINMLIDKLTEVWGNVIIHCNGKDCTVSDIREIHAVTAPTLVEALQLAVASITKGSAQ